RKEDGSRAFDMCIYTREEIERICRLAFEGAMNRRRKITLVDKANVLESSRLWRSVFNEIAADYPEVKTEHLYVDNAAMQIVLQPRQFDVIVTSNMFGDILSDEASVITGSMGLLPSASMGQHTSLFEPIHGSWPQAAGRDIANPIATILSAALMLDSFGMVKAAKLIRKVVTAVLTEGIGTPELKPVTVCGCSQMGDIIVSIINEKEDFKFKKGKFSASISTII
ncbi:MAG: isocitrate/isopropylmalate family dehydrogenase, partial [Bacteroidota bacterium]